MNPFLDLLRGRDKGMARYDSLRESMLSFHSMIVKTLDRDAVRKAASTLGVLRADTIVFDSEHAIAVVFDHAIYGMYADGRNAVQRFAAERPRQGLTSEQRILQDAATRASYRLLAVRGHRPTQGIDVHDTVRNERLFLTDRGLSLSAPMGGLFATRTMQFEGLTTTTGAALPVPPEASPEVDQLVERYREELLGESKPAGSPEREARFAADVIRACLDHGAAQMCMSPEEWLQSDAEPVRTSLRIGSAAVLDNHPCPCGSGRKYKKCCKRVGAKRSP